MMLRAKTTIVSAVLALPVAILGVYTVESLRATDQQTALARVVQSQLNPNVRIRCEDDPAWFLTGPLEGWFAKADRPTDPDALQPRPKADDQPFELFAYDDDFLGSSPAAPRFPTDLRDRIRSTHQPATSVFDTKDGAGVQIGLLTGWRGGPCAVFLGRLRPRPHQTLQRVELFAGFTVIAFGLAWLSAAPLVLRAQKMSSEARESVHDNFTSIAPGETRDELSSMTFAYNDAVTELHTVRKDVADRIEATRRYVTSTHELTSPLADLQQRIAAGESSAATARALHRLTARLENLSAAARVRGRGEPVVEARVDAGALVERVKARYVTEAALAGVTIAVVPATSPVVIVGDEALLEQAVRNVVDNAIEYSGAGSRVTIALAREATRFTLTVTDNGQGVTEDQFKGLNAIRRFRGDEGRSPQPGGPGLGLAVAREAAERFGLQFTLQRPRAGGFEVVFSGPATS